MKRRPPFSLRYADALRALRAVNASDALILEGVHSFWISCQARAARARARAIVSSPFSYL